MLEKIQSASSFTAIRFTITANERKLILDLLYYLLKKQIVYISNNILRIIRAFLLHLVWLERS